MDADRENTAVPEPDETSANAPDEHVADTPKEDAARVVKDEPAIDVDEYKESFGALRDSVATGRDLRRLKAQLADDSERIEADRKKLADRRYVLEHYSQIMDKQDAIIVEANSQIQTLTPRLDEANDQLGKANEQLEALREANKKEYDALEEKLRADTKKLQERLDETRASTRDAKAKAKASESDELTKEENDAVYRSTVESAKRQEREAKDDLDDARAEAKRTLRDKRQEHEDAEAEAKEQVTSFSNTAAKLDAQIRESKDRLEEAQKRRDWCQKVHDDPLATDDLERSIQERAAKLEEQRREIAAMEDTHETHKKGSGKAVGVIIGIAVIVVVIIILVLALG